jgi:hypothetical protein
MYRLCYLIGMLLAPMAARAAECKPPENIKVVNAKILDVEVADASKFPSHHPDVYYSTDFHVTLPGCTGIPVIVREIEPLAPTCRMGQTVNVTGKYMAFLVDKTNIYVAVYSKAIACR